MAISTRGLTAGLRAALAAHHADQRPGRIRAVTPADLATIVAAMRRLVKLAKPGDELARVTLHGGFVARSYGFRAPSDYAMVTMDLRPDAAVRYRFNVQRGYASHRKHGLGDLLTARLLRSGQCQGRRVDLHRKAR